MRSTNDYSRKSDCVQIIDDIRGGVKVCSPSGIVFEWMDQTDEHPWFDPRTGREMFYPGWAEW